MAPASRRSALRFPSGRSRAVADAPICLPEILAARAERLKQGWRLELFVPAQALQGFDPETNRRLGFAYQVSDPNREDQFLGVGRGVPRGRKSESLDDVGIA